MNVNLYTDLDIGLSDIKRIIMQLLPRPDISSVNIVDMSGLDMLHFDSIDAVI